jgi:hypothetical protein
MRALTLLLCLALAACNTTASLSGDPAPAAMTAPAPATPPPAAPPATTATAPTAPAAPAGPRDLTEAKVICWGKVEREKQRVRTIDQRIAYVERCVAEQMKTN